VADAGPPSIACCCIAASPIIPPSPISCAALRIATNTVKTHPELLFDKLDVSTRTEAVAPAARMGLLLL
jgi:hypothetical protein